MYVVKKIRKDQYHYLSVPDEILSWIKSDRIMKIGHVIPSLVITILIAVKLLPLFSNWYAEQLANNGSIIPATVFCFLIPILILNGMVLESYLEMTNPGYREFKKNDSQY